MDKINPLVCVQCNNIRPINSTDNRLVTESCGHVKCMDCLIRERSGCIACLKENDSNDTSNGNHCKDKLGKGEDDNCEGYDVPVEVIIVCADKGTDTSHIVAGLDEKGQYYLCTKCNKKCRSRRQLAYHTYCNGRLKPFQCPMPRCGKSFVTHSHFKYHMRVHRNEKLYSCDICGDGFIQKSKLQRHMLKHTQEKNYVCHFTQCGKAFKNISSLRQHYLVHTKEKPHICNICDVRFRDRSNYYKHLAIHKGSGKKRPSSILVNVFQCPHCTRTFRSGKDMRRHSAVHSDSKPFRCKICESKSFRRKDNLERHIRNSHPTCVTSTAIEVDEEALAEHLSIVNKPVAELKPTTETKEEMKLKKLNPLPPISQEIIEKHMYSAEDASRDIPDSVQSEKDKLIVNIEMKDDMKKLNPLPLLTREIIEKHMYDTEDERNNPEPLSSEKVIVNTNNLKETIDKSYILEANNARESVIFAPVNQKKVEIKNEPKEYGYVHKIRKANSIATRKDVYLPPIDETKMIELERKTTSDNLDVGSLPRNVELYQMILYDKPESLREGNKFDGDCDENLQSKSELIHSSPQKHWRRKMKLAIDWLV